MAAPTSAEIEAARKAGAVSYVLETSRGTVQLELRGDLMPLTVANFVKLAKSGFYDGLTFHRVEDWVVQGGDPQGDGTGGPGYTIRLETNPTLLNRTGAIAMARSADPDSAGSQFYISKKDADWLDGDYAVFGRVTSGMDVVNKLQVGDKIISIRPASGS
ncbi:MAG: peptidylprolyl isomerase [Limnochordaceae bacterium]|nr:peptidylprolyl isomerase [Limnochordaceae bacterium]